jgi:hypothetical protein
MSRNIRYGILESELKEKLKAESSVKRFREFLLRNLQQTFRTRDPDACPMAMYNSEIMGEPMHYNAPCSEVNADTITPWAPPIALAVDKEPGETVTAQRVLEIMDGLGIVES